MRPKTIQPMMDIGSLQFADFKVIGKWVNIRNRHRQKSRPQHLGKRRVKSSSIIAGRKYRRWYRVDQGSSTTALATLARRSIC
jgi:hypothetical protein